MVPLTDKMFFHMKISDLRKCVFEDLKMPPIHLLMPLRLILNIMVDSTYLSAVYAHVRRQT